MAKQKSFEMASVELLMVDAGTAARLVGVGRTHWYALISAGRVPPAVKLGSSSRWAVEDLKLWVSYGCPAIDKFIRLKAAKGKGI